MDTPADVQRLLSIGLSDDAEKPEMPFEDDSELEPGTQFGDYEIGEVLGRGGMGVVYRARHIGIHRTVALKVIRSGAFATEDDVQRFRAEAIAAAALEHQSIVPVYHFGQREGQPFFTMRLFEGGTLAQELDASRFTQRRALELMLGIAQAVQYAHHCGVLHRDLKPTNILLDTHGQPHVADFGIARRIDEASSMSPSLSASGHPDYMAPEQLSGEAGPTVAGDVYALGVVLYEMLTGTLPRREVLSNLVAAPSSLERVIPELDLICLKCLEPEPARRYASAAALGEDLGRCLRGELTKASPPGSAARLWWRLRRYPLLAIALVGATFVTLLSVAIAIWVGEQQTYRVREEILKVNRYAAQATAGQVLFKLRELSDQLSHCASEPAIVQRIQAGLSAEAEPDATEHLLRSCGATTVFDSIRIFDEEGRSLTRFPLGRQPSGLLFTFRNYWQGAHRLGELGRHGVYVGRAVHSESDDQIKLPLAAPVFAGDRCIGYLMATIGTDATLASLELPNDDRRVAVLVGLRDRERFERSAPEQYMVLVHKQLAHGQAETIEGPALSSLAAAAAQSRAGEVDQFVLSGADRVLGADPHRDPLLPGRWLAGIAPVGNTGYAVIVQTGQDTAAEAIAAAVLQLVALSGVLFVLGSGSVLGIARLVIVRRRRALG